MTREEALRVVREYPTNSLGVARLFAAAVELAKPIYGCQMCGAMFASGHEMTMCPECESITPTVDVEDILDGPEDSDEELRARSRDYRQRVAPPRGPVRVSSLEESTIERQESWHRKVML